MPETTANIFIDRLMSSATGHIGLFFFFCNSGNYTLLGTHLHVLIIYGELFVRGAKKTGNGSFISIIAQR